MRPLRLADLGRVQRWKSESGRESESLACANGKERSKGNKILPAGVISMLITKEQLPAIRTLRGWAIGVLQESKPIQAKARPIIRT